MDTAQIIQLSDYIPRKPAARKGQAYQCIGCGRHVMEDFRLNCALYCYGVTGCGAEMRPVETEAK